MRMVLAETMNQRFCFCRESQVQTDMLSMLCVLGCHFHSCQCRTWCFGCCWQGASSPSKRLKCHQSPWMHVRRQKTTQGQWWSQARLPHWMILASTETNESFATNKSSACTVSTKQCEKARAIAEGSTIGWDTAKRLEFEWNQQLMLLGMLPGINWLIFCPLCGFVLVVKANKCMFVTDVTSFLTVLALSS